MKPFETVRSDGRSAVTVLIDYVKGGAPGQMYVHADLCAALSSGASRAVTLTEMRRTVGAAYPRLLKEHQRALVSVRGVGYRIALADDHQSLAMGRKRRADVQLTRGLQTLKHVAWSELTPAARQLHEGTLMIMGALWENQQSLARRQAEVERAIAGLHARVDRIETPKVSD